jgi:hypothetical protein
MDSLRSARVVVVDDETDEALPLISALSKLGIGSLYYDGTRENLPGKPMSGIRLVFLDLRLVGGPTLQPKDLISQTLSVLGQIVDLNDCPAGIVYWTKHEEDETEFARQLTGTLPEFKPAFLLGIPDKMQLCDPRQVDRIQDTIIRQLCAVPACRLLWDWEQAVHDSATQSTGLLWSLTKRDGSGEVVTTLDDRLLELLCALSLADGASDQDDEAACLTHLFQGLNPLHYDQLENRVGIVCGSEEHVGKLRGKVHAGVTLTDELKSRLNGIFLAARVPDKGWSINPGNVYTEKGWSKDGDPFFLRKTARKRLERLVSELLSEKNPEKLKKLTDLSTPCLVELTPICDIANAKTGLARLLGGILIKSSGDIAFDKKIHLPSGNRIFGKQIEFCSLREKRLSGRYSLLLNARQLYSKPLATLRLHKPAFRLRHDVVRDIQAWFASHAARPGYFSLR